MQLLRAHASGSAEPSRSRGLGRESPKRELAAATVATSVAMLQTRYYTGCRRCRQINHHSIWGVILGYQRRPLALTVSARRCGPWFD